MVKKTKQVYICTECGADHAKWNGRCPSCGAWNSIPQEPVTEGPARKVSASTGKALSLSDVTQDEAKRLQSGIQEFNLVCGGGIVPGSVILVGGEPGIGKSTIALQVGATLGSLYISGEESPAQIRSRAERLGVPLDSIRISTSTEVHEIMALAEKEKPQVLIIDSIQTIRSGDLPGASGSVSQIRECTATLASFSKEKGIPVILIGHITKDGAIAGPKLLEHLVDTVLYFEGDFTRQYRLLRAFKNRYGSVHEVGLFEMTSKGLKEVTDKSRIFLDPSHGGAPGSAVATSVEGTRTLLFEVQSLVNYTSFANPRRMADGLDLNRLILLCAVLEKHAGLQLGSFDVFINIAGGFSVKDTSADLAVAASIASSLKEKQIPQNTAFIGELSLSGEIRPVSQPERRIAELSSAGYTKIFISSYDRFDESQIAENISLIKVSAIPSVLSSLFPE